MLNLANLSDDEWFSILDRSVDNRVVDGVTFPGFPPAERQIEWVGSAGRDSLREAKWFYRLVKERYSHYCGGPLKNGARILDFGVGWGRMARFFMRDTSELYGVDINKDILQMCRESELPVQLAHIDPVGHLPHPDRFFDIVFAYSVFTHLPERVADRWLAEISRALKPGGMFIATVASPRFIAFLRTEAANGHAWSARLKQEIETRLDLAEGLYHDCIYIPSEQCGEIYGDMIVTPHYVADRWGRHFAIRNFVDDPSLSVQAIVVAQKRS